MQPKVKRRLVHTHTTTALFMRHYTAGKTHTHKEFRNSGSSLSPNSHVITRKKQSPNCTRECCKNTWQSFITLETQTSPNYELAASWLTLNENEPYEPTDCKEKRAMHIWFEIHELEIAREKRHRQVAPAKASVRLTHQRRRGENIRRSARVFRGRNKIIFVTIFSASSPLTRWVSPV
jgi:hypothetical protein